MNKKNSAGIRSTITRSCSAMITLGLALIIGALAGLGAVAFRLMISGIQSIFFGGGAKLLPFLGDYYVIIIPVAGALIFGPIIYFFAREAKGNGIPEVMKAMAEDGGRIRPVVSVVKAVASSLCIGSGGSAGREGPIVQIGASFGSTIGQLLRLSDERLRTLAACGAAGGIAATFNAPVAGALFALEIILRKVVTPIFAYVFLSAVTANYVASFFIKEKVVFPVAPFQIFNPLEIVLYAVVGVISALVAVALIRAIYGCEDLFDFVKMPEYLKPALGGIAIGLIGLYNFNLFGLGYGEINSVLTGAFPITFLLSMFALKLAATSFTLGSGGSGGIFSPSLFIGAMLGVALGTAFQNIVPFTIGAPGAYGIVAMAAVFGAATRAPFTAVIMTLEITGDYAIILPVMAAVSISTAISAVLTRGTIYTTKLLREGVDINQEYQTGL
jgi:CIC family chloride channel protein